LERFAFKGETIVRVRLRDRIRHETGQVLVFTLVFMVVLVGMVGFAVDVGHAYLVQRQLQSGVDAAALAGAQELPDQAAVTNAATQYGPDSKNPPTANDNSSTTVEMRCVKSAPGCSATFNTFNAVKVTSTSDVKTFFARVLGIDSLKVTATATACSPCSSKPLDVMIVLDRTGSMCDATNGDGSCRDETNAINGIKTFLGYMDPKLDEVGLAVFPPAIDVNSRCDKPTSGGKNYGYNSYWPNWVPAPRGETPNLYAIASPDFDFLTQTSGGYVLNNGSPIVQMLDCIQPNGSTSYVDAIAEAQHELEEHGRGNVQDVMIVLTDGAANTTTRYVPSYIPTSHLTQPCTMGIDAASQSKNAGTIVYTIGYDVDADSNGGQCGLEGINASDALKQMATVDPSDGKPNYYLQPDPGSLSLIFTRIAADISRPSSRLIDDSIN
jgi:Flp pilus assembly protein TadG